MSDKTKIEWTDATWNPVTGCTKVSPGCDHCYAERVTERFHGPGSFDKVVLHPERLDQPLRWRRPRKVFVNSMSDLFHDDVPAEFIAQVFAVMAIARDHTFQILTKRHGRMRAMLSAQGLRDRVRDIVLARVAYPDADPILDPDWPATRPSGRSWWPLPNVWLGVSVEDQKWADIRVLPLLQTPAAVKFLSCEPLLGPIELTARPAYDAVDNVHWKANNLVGIDWVIVGGESGPQARPMHPDWARSIREQCADNGVPFLFKQWGEWTPDRTGQHLLTAHRSRYEVACISPAGEHLRETDPQLTDPSWAWMYRKGKRAAGRELDGRTWDQYPDAQAVPGMSGQCGRARRL